MVGGLLHAAGHRVTLLGRKPHLDAIRARALRISGIFGDHTIRGIDVAHDAARLGGPFDLIFCCVKSYDTAAAAVTIAAHLASQGVVVSMQNGLGNLETLGHVVGAERVLGARVIFGAELRESGAAHVTVIAEPVAIGPARGLAGSHWATLEARARTISRMLAEAKLPTMHCDDVMPIIWSKVLYNVALNPLGALLGLHYGALADDPDLRIIMNDAIDEAFEVARRQGVALPFRDPAAYRELFYRQLIPTTYDHRPSMLADLRKRARTEIDALNGRVVELGARHHVPTPTNQLLVRLVKAAERAARGAPREGM